MQRVEKFVQSVFSVVLIIICAFIVDFGVRFLVMSGIAYLPSHHDDTLLGMIGVALVFMGFLVQIKLQNTLGSALSWGLSIGLMLAGASLCYASVFGLGSFWWESLVSFRC